MLCQKELDVSFLGTSLPIFIWFAFRNFFRILDFFVGKKKKKKNINTNFFDAVKILKMC